MIPKSVMTLMTGSKNKLNSRKNKLNSKKNWFFKVKPNQH